MLWVFESFARYTIVIKRKILFIIIPISLEFWSRRPLSYQQDYFLIQISKEIKKSNKKQNELQNQK